jgi:hypothetical protein
MKLRIFRSKWLTKQYPTNALITPTNKSKIIELNLECDYSYNEEELMVSQYKVNLKEQVAIPLGDLTVKSVEIFPKCLEDGHWPHNFTLSDHGMVECVFTALANIT